MWKKVFFFFTIFPILDMQSTKEKEEKLPSALKLGSYLSFQIFTNFLSSIMIHATRPFVLNEWIQTTIQGYEVSGTVEVCIYAPSLRPLR